MEMYGAQARILRQRSRDHLAYVANLTEEERARRRPALDRYWAYLQRESNRVFDSATRVHHHGLAAGLEPEPAPAVEPALAAEPAPAADNNRQVRLAAGMEPEPAPAVEPALAAEPAPAADNNRQVLFSTDFVRKPKPRRHIEGTGSSSKKRKNLSTKEESKKIVVEHCKKSKSFKKRAKQVKKGLKKAVPGIIVTVNPHKPRRGCFEIREEGGETFISLLDMARPFTAMKELNMEQVIEDIIQKIK